MSTEDNENVAQDTEVTANEPEVSSQEPAEKPAKVEPRLAIERKNLRGLIKNTIKEVNKPEQDEPRPLTAKEKKAAEATESKPVEPKVTGAPATKDKANSQQGETLETKPEANKSTEAVPPVESQATGITPPAALTKDERAFWDKTPKEIQEAFLRREKDVQKGVDQLKAKYQPIEDVLSPVKGLLQQNGLTEAHAVKQLFDWHRALANPNKEQAFGALRALAQSHGINLSQQPQQTAQQFASQQPQTQTPQQQQQVDPLQQINELLEQKLAPVNQQLTNYAAEIQRQKLEAANAELATFSKDKPHFDKVRVRMAEILTTAANFGRPITLQEAYDEAVWGMQDIRNEILQEQEAKRLADIQAAQQEAQRQAQSAEAERLRKEAEAQAEAKRKEAEALERARRANVSPRGSAPVGAIAPKQPGKKAQSVADTIQTVMKELRSQ